MSHRNDRSLKVAALTRVEGEAAMLVRVVGDQVEQVQLNIYEPPRFFEAFLRGRSYTEPPDITARICGICPVAYQMSACKAIEQALGIVVDGQIAQLRRLLYCGEWISSHALHIYLLHAPDFLGYASAVELARDHRAVVERGLALKKVGNEILELVGGRAIHPINVRIGGFYQAPTLAQLRSLRPALERALTDALATVRLVSDFDFPDFTHDHELLALVEPGRYAIYDGQPTTDRGHSFSVTGFDEHIIEEHVAHSTALHAHLLGRGRYLTGPLARFALSRDWLHPQAKQAAAAAGLDGPCRNPFRSIVVRAVEVVHAVEEALAIVDGYQPPAESFVAVSGQSGAVAGAEPIRLSKASVGFGATEAPRGTLLHRYDLAEDATISAARIVPPTSQNQAAIEDDLRRYVQARVAFDDHRLTHDCEQAIRNYDPCISCATHFLDLTVQRT